MNIHTVAQNLRNMITDKEILVRALEYNRMFPQSVEVGRQNEEFIAYTKGIINELKKILADVEVCCKQYSEMDWQINPERMGQ